MVQRRSSDQDSVKSCLCLSMCECIPISGPVGTNVLQCVGVHTHFDPVGTSATLGESVFPTSSWWIVILLVTGALCQAFSNSIQTRVGGGKRQAVASFRVSASSRIQNRCLSCGGAGGQIWREETYVPGRERRCAQVRGTP